MSIKFPQTLPALPPTEYVLPRRSPFCEITTARVLQARAVDVNPEIQVPHSALVLYIWQQVHRYCTHWRTSAGLVCIFLF